MRLFCEVCTLVKVKSLLQRWVQAVKDTGYEGWWSYELISAKHWQCDVAEVAAETSRLLDKYVLNR